MTGLIRTHYDRLLVALAAVLLAVSGGWMGSHQSDIARLRQQPVAVHLTGADYAPVDPSSPRTRLAVWSTPALQSHGSGWRYEVFTPPVIYYDASARSFTVTPSMNPGGGSFGFELLDVRLEPFRLQLVGYFGEPDDHLAAFISPGQSETLLARSGRRFDRLGLTLKSVVVKKVAVAHADAWPVCDVAALAVLLNEQSGEEVVLDSRARKLTGTPLALLRLQAAGGPVHTLHEGETFADGMATYRIERIQLDPPEVVVARQTPGLPLPETRILRPAGRDSDQSAGQPAGDRRISTSLENSSTTNSN